MPPRSSKRPPPPPPVHVRGDRLSVRRPGRGQGSCFLLFASHAPSLAQSRAWCSRRAARAPASSTTCAMTMVRPPPPPPPKAEGNVYDTLAENHRMDAWIPAGDVAEHLGRVELDPAVDAAA